MGEKKEQDEDRNEDEIDTVVTAPPRGLAPPAPKPQEAEDAEEDEADED